MKDISKEATSAREATGITWLQKRWKFFCCQFPCVLRNACHFLQSNFIFNFGKQNILSLHMRKKKSKKKREKKTKQNCTWSKPGSNLAFLQFSRRTRALADAERSFCIFCAKKWQKSENTCAHLFSLSDWHFLRPLCVVVNIHELETIRDISRSLSKPKSWAPQWWYVAQPPPGPKATESTKVANDCQRVNPETRT